MRSQIDGAFKWIMGWYGSAQEAAPWDEQLRADLLAASIAALTRSGHPQSPALAERLAQPL